MRKLSHLFDNNRAWAAEITEETPDFFARLTRQQSPEYLWIGSRIAGCLLTRSCG